MPGERDLAILLKRMTPVLGPETYVYCTIPQGRYGDYSTTQPLACITEAEGLTLILPQSQADAASLPYQGTFRCISLSIHSSLEAVGLTAAVASQLAKGGISANMLAGYYHDHILVPSESSASAVELLEHLSR